MSTTRFTASLDSFSKIISGALAAFTLILVVVLFFTLKENPFILLLPIFILMGTFIYAYFTSPIGYEVNDEGIIILRRLKPYLIPGTKIQEIRPLADNELGRSWRVMGNGGMLGYTGWYSTSLGKMRWFVSQRKNYILIKAQSNQQYLISPDDPHGFMNAVSAKA